MRDRLRERLYPNPFRQLNKVKRILNKSEFPEIEESQDYMDALIVEHKNKQKEADKNEKPTPKKQENVPFSARFSQGLGRDLKVDIRLKKQMVNQ